MEGQFENFFYSEGQIAQEYNEYFETEKKITGTFVNNKKSGEWIGGIQMSIKNTLETLNGYRHGSWVSGIRAEMRSLMVSIGQSKMEWTIWRQKLCRRIIKTRFCRKIS